MATGGRPATAEAVKASLQLPNRAQVQASPIPPPRSDRKRQRATGDHAAVAHTAAALVRNGECNVDRTALATRKRTNTPQRTARRGSARMRAVRMRRMPAALCAELHERRGRRQRLPTSSRMSGALRRSEASSSARGRARLGLPALVGQVGNGVVAQEQQGRVDVPLPRRPVQWREPARAPPCARARARAQYIASTAWAGAPFPRS